MNIVKWIVALVAIFNFGDLVADALVPGKAKQAFPGTGWTDPEFAAETPRPLGLAPQQLVTYVLCGLMLVAMVLAVAT